MKHKITEILLENEAKELPTDYLTARIKGRRSYLLQDWNNVLFNPDPAGHIASSLRITSIPMNTKDDIWKRLRMEYFWVYMQMNKRLRDVFRSFFIYQEVISLIQCFRLITKTAKKKKIENILSLSLLNNTIKEVIINCKELSDVLEACSGISFLEQIADETINLKQLYTEKGFPALEQMFIKTFLEKIITSEIHNALKKYFTLVINIKNIITVYKHIRWNISSPPIIIRGGDISISRMMECVNTGKIEDLRQLVLRQTGIHINNIESTLLENILIKNMTKQLRIYGRVYGDIGLILDYLWRYYIETFNLSIIFSGKEISKESLKEELAVS